MWTASTKNLVDDVTIFLSSFSLGYISIFPKDESLLKDLSVKMSGFVWKEMIIKMKLGISFQSIFKIKYLLSWDYKRVFSSSAFNIFPIFSSNQKKEIAWYEMRTVWKLREFAITTEERVIENAVEGVIDSYWFVQYLLMMFRNYSEKYRYSIEVPQNVKTILITFPSFSSFYKSRLHKDFLPSSKKESY